MQPAKALPPFKLTAVSPDQAALVSLVRPPVVVAKWAHTTPTCPPVGLAYLAGTLLAAGHRIKVVDAIGEAHNQYLPLLDDRFLSHGLSAAQIAEHLDPASEVIGISCMFSHEWPLMREIIRALRQRCPQALIIAGGEHITALPEFSLENCPEIDIGVLGEGEETLAELVGLRRDAAALRSVAGIVTRGEGGIVRTKPRARIRSIDDIPEPAWSLFPLDVYLDNGYSFGVNRGRSMPLVATRGCPYQCTFCSNPTMWTTRWVARKPEAVIREIRDHIEKYRVDNIDFYDLTAIVKKKWVVEFCALVEKSGLKFTWQLPSGTRSEAIDEEVSRLLYESGCRNMSYAPESGSPAVLERIKKHIDLGEMKKSMRAAIRNGINSKANIILGFPGETHREMWQTLWFCVEMAALGLHDMSISPFSPYPGSELFEDLRKQGKISNLTDEYFYSLAAYTDLSKTVSLSEHVGNRALGFYRIFGMLLFYSVSYLCHPWRLVTTIRNVLFSKTQESRLEMSLHDMIKRLAGAKSSAEPLQIKAK